ncbi:MAG TPA: hypothetical protein VNW50_06675 [Streptosporangiaceae bacterium]|jgi:hypothetical protein|nr:hypothetical protein [Streptosporangiaceae bacterium]
MLLEKEFDAMAEFADAGNLAAIVECDTRLHGLLVEAGGRVRPAELWRALDGQMCALMWSSVELHGDAVSAKDRVLMAAPTKEQYLKPRSFHDNDDLG